MKTHICNLKFLLVFVSLIILATILFTSSANNPKYQIPIDSLKKDSIVCYEVFGMDCPGCQSALEKQLGKIEGVKESKANWKKKEVVISLDPNTNVKEEEILKRIKKANFTPGKEIKQSKK